MSAFASIPLPQSARSRLARAAVRGGWLIAAALLLVPFALSVPSHYRFVVDESARLWSGLDPNIEAAFTGKPGPHEVAALRGIGLSPRAYAVYLVAIEIGLTLGCAAVGGFIFWRRSEDWLAVWVSLVLLDVGPNGPFSSAPALATASPALLLISIAAAVFGMISHVHLLFLLPDGHFIPRWTRALGAGFIGLMLGTGIYIASIVGRWGLVRSLGPLLLVGMIWFTLLGVGVLCQVYRYLRVSGPVQRQQAKWVAAGLGAMTLGFGVNAVYYNVFLQFHGRARVILSLIRHPVVALLLVLFPICLAFSILRYRLWDIDLILRRTLIYATLTAALALVYYAAVLLLQSIFRSAAREAPEIVLVVSTLVIAVLFTPLRRRIQNDIDRRFYRQKYDREQVLSTFSAALRDEVDLDRLANLTVRVVLDTVQPDFVSLLLLDEDARRRQEGSAG